MRKRKRKYYEIKMEIAHLTDNNGKCCKDDMLKSVFF